MTTRTIFTSDITDLYTSFEEARKEVAERLEKDIKEVSDNEVYDELHDQVEMDYEDLNLLFNKVLDNRIIAFGKVGRWNGTFGGYKILGDNLKDILTYNGCDEIKIKQKGKNVYWTGYHHDGAIDMELRLIKNDNNIDNFLNKIYNNEPISRATVNYYTKAFGDEINNILG